MKTHDLKNFLEMDLEILLGIYYDLYNHFMEVYTKNNDKLDNSNFDKDFMNLDKLKYEEIVKCLEMTNLILNSNILNENKISAIKIYYTKNDMETRKALINTILIKLIDDKLKIFNDILKVIQYLNDFIVFNKIDKVLLKDHTLQFRIFIEIKGLMFNHLNRKTKDNLIFNTLTDRKYTEDKYKRFGNKLHFIKNPVASDRKEKENNNVFDFLTGVDEKKSNFMNFLFIFIYIFVLFL
jgi:hypothetical protein